LSSATIPLTESAQPTGYMRQLDGLRAIAVGMVVVQHYWPASHWLHEALPWGQLGVHLFFVLSGFLIVGGLLRERDAVSADSTGMSRVVKNFYLRRAIRIFPVFYLALFAAILLGLPGARETFWYHAAYLSNVISAVDAPGAGAIVHFWTLAVEEQFYLVVPWLVLLMPRKLILPMLWSIVGLALTAKVMLVVHRPEPGVVAAICTAVHCSDSLAIGGVLAVLDSSSFGNQLARKILTNVGLWIAMPLMVVEPILRHLGWVDHLLGSMSTTCWALAFAWIVWRSAKGFRGLMGRLLSQNQMVAIGRVSYGIYVYHFMVPWALGPLLRRLGLALPSHPLPKALLFIAVTTAVVLASWCLVEKPLGKFKKHFRAAKANPIQPTKASLADSQPVEMSRGLNRAA